MASHKWVIHVLMPIEVMPSLDDGSPDVLIDQEKLIEAVTKHAVYGCAVCSTPLTSDDYGRPCPGAEADPAAIVLTNSSEFSRD